MAKPAKNSGKKLEFDGQHDDEEVLLVFRRHPIAMRKGLVILLVVLLIGMIPSAIWPTRLELLWITGAALLIGFVIMFYYWIGWHFSVFIVTDQRLMQISQKGLFNRSVADIGLNKIQSVNYEVAGIQETLFSFGTIMVQTYVGDMILDQIYHPSRIHEKIVKIIKEQGFDVADPGINDLSG